MTDEFDGTLEPLDEHGRLRFSLLVPRERLLCAILHQRTFPYSEVVRVCCILGKILVSTNSCLSKVRPRKTD